MQASLSILTVSRQLKEQKEIIKQMEEKVRSLIKSLQWEKAEWAEVAGKLEVAEKSNIGLRGTKA